MEDNPANDDSNLSTLSPEELMRMVSQLREENKRLRNASEIDDARVHKRAKREQVVCSMLQVCWPVMLRAVVCSLFLRHECSCACPLYCGC